MASVLYWVLVTFRFVRDKRYSLGVTDSKSVLFFLWLEYQNYLCY